MGTEEVGVGVIERMGRETGGWVGIGPGVTDRGLKGAEADAARFSAEVEGVRELSEEKEEDGVRGSGAKGVRVGSEGTEEDGVSV